MPEQLPASLGNFNLYVDTTLVVALAAVIWTVARRLSQELYFMMSLRTEEISFRLAPKKDIPGNIKSLNYLFIRYGNDSYLEKMASDEERYHGRLRNKVVCVTNKKPRSGDEVMVRIRLHKRLGTQFKFFIDIEGDPKPAVQYLNDHPSINDVFCKKIPGTKTSGAEYHRVFFLVDWLETVKTVDGHTNNFIYPV